MKNQSNISLTIVLIATIQISCSQLKQEYENNSKSCNLKLYENKNYEYKFSHFLGQTFEKGSYYIHDTNLVLIRKEKNSYPENEFSTTYLYDNPKTLKITFENLNRELIDVEFKVNKSNKTFSTNSGKIEIAYHELEQNELISKGVQVENLSVHFNNKKYEIDSMALDVHRRPTHFDVTLNDFKNEKEVLLKRNYVIKNDKILMNDMNIKNIGTRNRYLQKKEIR